MKYHESIEVDEKEYIEKYGDLPNGREELTEYLMKKLKVSEKDVVDAIEDESKIPWREIKLTLNVHPYATPRPRATSAGVFYVRGAKKHRKLILHYIEEKKIIYTKTHFIVRTYQETPKAVSKLEKVLFEMGVYQPLSDPDWDNLGKTYSDMVQQVLLLNDNIIVDGRVEKYYSIKPRVEIVIQYQESFDSKFNRKRVMSTKMYQTLIEEGGNNSAYK